MGSRARMLVELCLESNRTMRGSTSVNEILESEGPEKNNDGKNIATDSEVKLASNVADDEKLCLEPDENMKGSTSINENLESEGPEKNNDEKNIATDVKLASTVTDDETSFEDFSADDSADEYKPEKPVKRRRRRRRINSTSSSSPSSSSSSSSSTSSSSTSINNDTTKNSNLQNTSQDLVLPPEITTETSVAKKGKKRVRNESAWIKNVRKKQKNCGKQYLSRTGKTVPERSMKQPCTDKCRLKCSNTIQEEQRREIFNSYWSLGTLQRQRDFLSSCLTKVKVAYRRIKEGTAKNRNQNCAFHLTVNGESKRVCKTFYLNTLGISERTMRTVIDAKSCNTGMIPEDKRGKHAHHNQISPEILQSVRDHISAIPRIESHYTRAHSSREFIDGGLTIKELHRYYTSNRELIQSASYDTYARIFNTEFNISFFIPKKDQCDLCESYKNAIGEEKLKLETPYEEHQKQKDLSRKEKAQDIELCKKGDGETVVATYDLQAVMPVPIGNSSAFFYKSKLNCLNFTVSDLKNNTTNCYFWHEGLGNRGANEIGSCVLKFLVETSKRHPNCNVIFYSDNCCGQQKNRFLLGMYYYAVETLELKSITHKYLIRGHTQNEGDNAHSLIEKAIKRAKKSGPIYVPDQYVQLIRGAKKTGNAFIVNELNYDDFYDFKKLFDDIALNTIKDLPGEPIKLSEIKVVRFVKNSESYDLKYSYASEWVTVKTKIIPKNTRKTRSDNNFDMTEISLRPAYNSKLSISDPKKQDLKALLDKNIVPRYYSGFYQSLF